ncbi:hypothetical protein [Streptomyces sp. RKAG290]|uniref:hypothetical protein n=1 Tax=Streptomyces sp. RKAG290 TaxID=2888348 RepID=UPI0035A84BA1
MAHSRVAAQESGRTSRCQILNALRLGPDGDVAEVTAAQVRRVATDHFETCRWKQADRDILVVSDAGYDASRHGPSPGRTADRGSSVQARWGSRRGRSLPSSGIRVCASSSGVRAAGVIGCYGDRIRRVGGAPVWGPGCAPAGGRACC